MTIARYLPASYEKKNVEELFKDRFTPADNKNEDAKDFIDQPGVRKRVLISCNFTTSF